MYEWGKWWVRSVTLWFNTILLALTWLSDYVTLPFMSSAIESLPSEYQAGARMTISFILAVNFALRLRTSQPVTLRKEEA